MPTAVLRELLAVDPAADRLVDVLAVEELGREHPLARRRFVDHGERDPRVPRSSRETLGVGRLDGEIELGGDRLVELIDQSYRIVNPRFGDRSLEDRGQKCNSSRSRLDGARARPAAAP